MRSMVRDAARRFLCLALLVLSGMGEPAWGLPGQAAPGKTRVFVVGVLKFQDSDLASWSGYNRRDSQFVQYFKERGVALDHLVYLADQQATGPNILNELNRFLERSAPGDCLVFYYTGHGGHEDDGVGTFSTHDKGGYLNQDQLVGTIDKKFRGNRAILLADCCESGRLADAVERAGSKRIDYAVMTSSSPNEHGNGQWTFSQGILDGLRGHPVVDLNHDGKITWTELGNYMKDEMAALDETHSVFRDARSWSAVADVVASTAPLPRRLLVDYQGTRYRAKGVDSKGDQVRIRWTQLGYDTAEQDQWVPRSTVQPISLVNHMKVGAQVMIEYEGSWYPGRVLKTDRGLCLVHYDGYPASSDSWIGESHVKVR